MRQRKRKHDDAHRPLQGKGKRAARHTAPPRGALVSEEVRCPRCKSGNVISQRMRAVGGGELPLLWLSCPVCGYEGRAS